MMNYNLSKVDLANVGTGKGLKECGRDKIKGTLNGFGIVKAQSVDAETGEVEEKEISVVKVDGVVYSGASKVMAGRLETLADIIENENDVKDGKIKVHFDNISCKSGDGVTMIIDEYAD